MKKFIIILFMILLTFSGTFAFANTENYNTVGNSMSDVNTVILLNKKSVVPDIGKLRNALSMKKKAKSALIELGINDSEADEIVKMLSASGLDVRWLTPTTEEYDADYDPEYHWALSDKRGFFSDAQINEYYDRWETKGAVDAMKYALGINSYINYEYVIKGNNNRLDVAYYDYTNYKSEFFMHAILYGLAGGIKQFFAPFDFFRSLNQERILGRTITLPVPSYYEDLIIGEQVYARIISKGY